MPKKLEPDKTLRADGFESAFLGVIHRCGQPTVYIYEYHQSVDILMSRDDMSQEDAEEYLEFNTIQAWMGKGTPGFLVRCTLEEADDAETDGPVEKPPQPELEEVNDYDYEDQDEDEL